MALALLGAQVGAAQSLVYPVGNQNVRPTSAPGNPNGYYISRRFSEPRDDGALHSGVDLANGNEGGAVRSIGSGTVVSTLPEALSKGLGNVVLIRHVLTDGTIYSMYAHLQNGSVLVTDGDPVVIGQKIAQVDCTGATEGTSTCASNGMKGAHLHFSIKRTSGFGCGYISSKCTSEPSLINYVDPLAFIAARSTPPTSITYQPGPEGFDTVYGSAFLPGPNGNVETLHDGGWGDYYRNFFRWDLSSLPQASSVSQVLLHLYFGATGNDPAFQVRRVTSPWDEATLTRSNYPTAVAWGNWTGIVTTGWYTLDITDLFRNWKNGTWLNYGIELAPTRTIQTNGYIISSDYQADPTLRPKLVITMQ